MKRLAVLTVIGLLGAATVVAATSDASALKPRKRSLGGSFEPLEGPKVLMSEARFSSSATETTIENGDGTYEGVWGLFPDQGVDQTEWVQRFTLPASTGVVTDASVCFSSDFGGSFDFDFLIFAANGNRPGTEQLRVAFRTPQLGAEEIECLLLPEIDFPTSTNRYFIGVQFSANDDILVLADENSPEAEPSYVRAPGVTGWERLGSNTTLSSDFEPFRNLALAINFDDQSGPTGSTDPCVEDAQTLCLGAGDRFEVRGSWVTNQGTSGQAQMVEFNRDSGWFWFFDVNNAEGLIKVLDACSFSDHYWVFVGGVTNVEVELEVRDSLTGFVKIYRNPLDVDFQPILDTGAFATCP